MSTPLDAAKLTRRSWLQGSALIALYAWTPAGARVLAPAPPGVYADAIVIDAALPGARALAHEAQALARVEMLADDVAELFYGRLAPAWRDHGVRGLAGLTRAPGLFLLEPLAREYGLRTVGLGRSPRTDCAAFASPCPGQTLRPASMELIHEALLGGDDTAFVWRMAPVRRPLRTGITVIPA